MRKSREERVNRGRGEVLERRKWERGRERRKVKGERGRRRAVKVKEG